MRSVRGAETQALFALPGRHRQIMTVSVAETNRLNRAVVEVRPRIQSHITWLEQEPHDVDTELRRMIRRSPELREQDELFHNVPGRGRQVCLTLLADLPALGTLDGKQFAAPVGVAPCDRDSGKHRGKRIVWGRRYRVRPSLHMGALVASRWNPLIRDFCQRLLARGKPKEPGLTACMPNSLTIRSSMVRTGQRWDATIPTSRHQRQSLFAGHRQGGRLGR